MWKNRWTSIVEKTHVVHSPDEVKALLDSLASGTTPRVLGFVNAHAMNRSAANEAFFDSVVHADVLLRDGLAMAMLYRTLEKDPGLNMNGTDFIPKLLATFRERTVALWGTEEPYVAEASKRCESEFGVQVVSTENGFKDFSHYLHLAHAKRPELILLGMGMPKQELLAQELLVNVRNAPLIVCGGAILDFLGGKVQRAPEWARRVDGEWLYRLYCEPRRLFRRYVVGNPMFVLRLLAWRREGRLHK
jgi:exopolysaccharide biosynthesis WecB/TagA/CpsF family protein